MPLFLYALHNICYFRAMKRPLIALLLFLAQIYLTFWGVKHFSKYGSPVVLFAVSVGIAWIFWKQIQTDGTDGYDANTRPAGMRWKQYGALTGLLSFVLCYEELRKLFAKWTPPGDYSDVLPQLEALYYRYAEGIQPYYPVKFATYEAYPVYMPMHWMPIGLASALECDTRWIGFGMMALAAAWYGWQLMRAGRSLLWQIIAILLPSLSLWGFILWGEMDIPVSFELVVAAYYLVLAAGLQQKQVIVITTGLILCFLSRYTMLFWLPLFAVLLWDKIGWRRSAMVWGSLALSFIFLYALPFLKKQPDILKKGVTYHNEAAIAEWNGYDNVSWTMERGVHFAIYLKEALHDTPEREVFWARVIQAGMMLFLMFAGLWLYRRMRSKVNAFDISLLFLYLIVLCFYTFGPLTYRYYLIVLQMLSAVLCGRVIATGPVTTSK